MTFNETLPLNIYLADDDPDDCLLFEEALREVSKETRLITVHDGVQLMKILGENVPPPPDVIFLDLNMPRKNGFECLAEIRNSALLGKIPVVILSTSSSESSITKSYELGANHYICKPGVYSQLKVAIRSVLSINWKENLPMPPKDSFILHCT